MLCSLILLLATFIFSSLFAYLSSKGASRWMSGALAGAICFNPFLLGLLQKDLFDSVQQICWVFFILEDTLERADSISYALLGVSSALNPSNLLFFILKIRDSPSRQKVVAFVAGLGLGLSVVHLTTGISGLNFYRLYFPQSFSAQWNLLWMLFGHMFSRYLWLYQLIFVMILIGSIYLVGSMPFSHGMKVVLLTYFKVYCTYTCSHLCIVLALLVSVIFLYSEIGQTTEKWLSLGQQNEIAKLKTMSLIAGIANIVFLPLDGILLRKYLNDFTLNIGYLFLFFGFPWIINSVYLAQLSININHLLQLNRKAVKLEDER